MDRFKEALDQKVRGQWLSSISLCGDIVEFIVNEFWEAYSDMIPIDRRKTPSSSVEDSLDVLKASQVLVDEDYQRLRYVRRRRDEHVHNYPRKLFLERGYQSILNFDSSESIKKLSEFFAKKNVESKYAKYLDYATARYSTA